MCIFTKNIDCWTYSFFGEFGKKGTWFVCATSPTVFTLGSFYIADRLCIHQRCACGKDFDFHEYYQKIYIVELSYFFYLWIWLKGYMVCPCNSSYSFYCCWMWLNIIIWQIIYFFVIKSTEKLSLISTWSEKNIIATILQKNSSVSLNPAKTWLPYR